MCQARTPSQSPYVGACAKVQGHGIAHLQTSNQSPATCHSKTWDIVPPFVDEERLGDQSIRSGRPRIMPWFAQRLVPPLFRTRLGRRRGELGELRARPTGRDNVPFAFVAA